MIIASYARYSEGKDQTDSSIDSQQMIVNEFALKEFGTSVSLPFQDAGMCGVLIDRPGFQAMLNASELGEFDVLLIDDLSRLSRDDPEMKKTLQRLIFRNVRVIAVADGYDSSRDGHEVTAFAKGFVNHIFRTDLKKKTIRGLRQTFQDGHHAGGRCYGYDHEAIEHPTKTDSLGRPLIDSVKRKINNEQAEVIRKILHWYGIDKKSPAWIANELNQLCISPPRGKLWTKTAITGHKKKGTGILNNQLYIGLSIWNRSEWVRNPDTGKRVRLERPKDEWITKELPDLRIVSQKLWDAVRKQQKDKSIKSHEQTALTKMKGNKNAQKFILSGLLKCGVCGANFTMVNNKRYGCGGRKNRGLTCCTNSITIDREKIELILLSTIKQDLLSPAAIELFRSEVAATLKTIKPHNPTIQINRELEKIQKHISNIMDAIRDGIRTKTTLEELRSLEYREQELSNALKIAEKETAEVHDIMPRITDTYKTIVRNLESTDLSNVPRIRDDLKLLLGEINLSPDISGKHLNAEIENCYAGLMRIAFSKSKIQVVAGTGFEPMTFGL